MWNDWTGVVNRVEKVRVLVCSLLDHRLDHNPSLKGFRGFVYWNHGIMYPNRLNECNSSCLKSRKISPLRAFYWRKSPQTPLSKTKPLC